MIRPFRLDESSLPSLPRHVKLRFDERRDRWVLLAPERLYVPNPSALEILKRCTGVDSVATIADDLAETYSAPRERVVADVTELLQDLADKGFLTA